jgi:hypothetical protein
MLRGTRAAASAFEAVIRGFAAIFGEVSGPAHNG